MDTAATPRLPAELTIYAAAELRAAWLPWLDAEADAPLELEAGAVDQIDAAGLQLLIALWQALLQRGRTLRLIEPSLALRSACEELGLNGLLEAGGTP